MKKIIKEMNMKIDSKYSKIIYNLYKIIRIDNIQWILINFLI